MDFGLDHLEHFTVSSMDDVIDKTQIADNYKGGSQNQLHLLPIGNHHTGLYISIPQNYILSILEEVTPRGPPIIS